MPRHEPEIQKAISAAIEFFFMDPRFGFALSCSDIRTISPASGGQAKTADDFGRKPYDLGFFAKDTIVLFFEIKERAATGKIAEFKPDQRDMLKTLASNGVNIPFAYNSWVFDWRTSLTANDVLQQAHVRQAKDMTESIDIDPLPPAQILQDYLRAATDQGSQTLIEVLNQDIRQIDNFNSMPLMILANLGLNDTKVLIDRAPRGALSTMRNLFNLPVVRRQAELARLGAAVNGIQQAQMAQAIFAMKDKWVLSRSLAPNPGPNSGPNPAPNPGPNRGPRPRR